MAYSLAGQPFSQDDERTFHEALLDNLMKYPQVIFQMHYDFTPPFMLTTILKERLDWIGDDDVASMLRQHYQAKETKGTQQNESLEPRLIVLQKMTAIQRNTSFFSDSYV